MERFARTVLGDIKGEEMGFTYPHEHLHAVPPPCQKDRDLELSSYENSVQELLNFKEVGDVPWWRPLRWTMAGI